MKSKIAAYAGLALLIASVSAAMVLYSLTPQDPHYGIFPKLMRAAMGLIGVVPAGLIIAIANIRSRVGLMLLCGVGSTVAGFLFMNVVIGGFGLHILSFLFLLGGLIACIPLTLILLWKGLRSSCRSGTAFASG